MALCVLLSLLLHAGLAWALDLLPRSEGGRQKPPVPRAQRHVQVLRAKPRNEKAEAKRAEPPKEVEKAFAKTSADERERRPKEADFIGRHEAVASGMENAPQRQSDAPLPTMAGRESEEEIVTFDQERQDGDLAHEGKTAEAAQPPPAPPELADSPLQPAPSLAQGRSDGNAEQATPEGEGAQEPQPAASATAAREPHPATLGEGLKLGDLHTEDALTLSPALPPPAALGQAEGTAESAASTAHPHHARMAVRDPSLAAHVRQPGLRTHERRTRSTGRFVFGRRPSLNVAATVRGRYEAEIYRRIARRWYAACDEHRGDIIPGSITVSLRLSKSGRIDSMDLVRRRGASIIQQSFSFGAIRQSALPPMPPEVQRDIIGELYEMILTFNFD